MGKICCFQSSSSLTLYPLGALLVHPSLHSTQYKNLITVLERGSCSFMIRYSLQRDHHSINHWNQHKERNHRSLGEIALQLTRSIWAARTTNKASAVYYTVSPLARIDNGIPTRYDGRTSHVKQWSSNASRPP